MQDLTLSERVAICGLVCGVVDNWADCYLIGAQKYGDLSINRNNLRPTVSRWKNSAKVVKEYERLTAELATRTKAELSINDNLREGEKLSGCDNKERLQNGKRAQIDYTRPENQRTLLNDLINTAGDQKDKLDALKTIIQAQKDDRQAAKDNQIQRFYTPLKCHDCPLYQKSTKK